MTARAVFLFFFVSEILTPFQESTENYTSHENETRGQTFQIS